MSKIAEKWLVKPSVTESSVRLMEVKPKLALELLKTNTRNRPVNDARVSEYAAMMLNGDWQDGVADIVIGADGVLQNGQHTLYAIVESGVAATVTFKTGMPVEAQAVTDTQRARTLGNQLQIDGVKNANTVAAIARYVYAWRSKGSLPAMTSTGSVNLDIDRVTLLAYIHANLDELESAAGVGATLHRKSGLLTATQIGVLYVMFSDYAPEHAQAWIDQVFGSSGVSEQPVQLYRDRLVQMKGKTDNKKVWSIFQKYAFAVKSFNAYMARANIRRFTLSPNEQSPSVIVPEGVN